ncbi:prolipoprotein diacylglyceryl transferase [Polymorphobacter glacialis]|uniref:Phosphatidylglycerol--prolipoprotein diacylglyceryl transferase n=1 Tax=Sandarakinorhabdus glacialis TaxID=1614636 RepID=A0A916ZYM1_9SPHN|nr:prolipoprotein diacylglyceryl transferase [Polymorphobacter glacialis]GGE18719.1 prolipoprotein diacylglyceryl transferase [Polymorphobacter glacialis]
MLGELQIAVDFTTLPLRPDVFTIDAFVAFGRELGPFSLRWYSLSYIAAIVLGWCMLAKMIKLPGSPMNSEQLDSFITWATLGVIIGGRLGYVLFYNPDQYMAEPLSILRLWDGGMSSHGGIAGVLIACFGFGRANKVSGLRTLDFVAVVSPLGLGLGRLANFVNGELWGRPTGTNWGVIFPDAGPEPRYPSQLFEATLEGAILLSVMLALFWGTRARLRPGLLAGVFGVCYGISRFIVEFFREPDRQLGFLSSGLTMGQTLTIPMVIIGGILILRAVSRPPLPLTAPLAA